MAKFNPAEYETVEDRLKVFWKDNPEGRIETEILHITPDGQCVTIQASVFKQAEDARPVATGIAQETKGQGGFANADAWMENCETSALGRALANWKYQGSNKKRPSAEEMMKVGNEDVKVTKVDKRKKENKTSEEVKAITEESIAKFEEDIGYNKETSLNNAKQIAKIIDGFGLADDIKDKVKSKAWKQFIGAGHNKDVEQWDNDTIGAYLDLFEGLIPEFEPSNDTDIVEDVFGEVTTTVVRTCPECNSPDWIEDNREKKASDERFAKIPSWSCSTYQSNKGCGWTAWGDTDCPTEWL
tara:strand:+ start:16875 stop:17771 length:897 start_codon:yes stop_codon:yes gene_type:complete